MPRPLAAIIGDYAAGAPLDRASTIPSSWYTDPRVLDLERRSVFAGSWLCAGRLDLHDPPGTFVALDLPDGEPVVAVRGGDGHVRAFFNVCRHHAATVVTDPRGTAAQFRCPYHGWTYGIDGALKGTPDFAGVCDFDRAAHGLVPLDCGVHAGWVFVRPDRQGPPLAEALGADLSGRLEALDAGRLHWVERRHYTLGCNWKVFVDNYLDGGYHVPHVHGGLDSVLSYRDYTIENGERFCLQSSPLVTAGADARTAAVRQGARALYYWLYPNFMINWYGDTMDTNMVIPRGVDATEVVFDFYFADASPAARAHNRASIEVSQQIQDEDVAVCESVQRGLRSRAYGSGRLSVRREAGEQLFHRLLHADLAAALAGGREPA